MPPWAYFTDGRKIPAIAAGTNNTKLMVIKMNEIEESRIAQGEIVKGIISRGERITNMTPEERAAAREKAREIQNQRHTEWRANANKLKTDFSDKGFWHRAARHYGVTMPGHHVPGTYIPPIRRAMKKMGLLKPGEGFAKAFRETIDEEYRTFLSNNPDWPAFAIIGLLLECALERDGIDHLPTDRRQIVIR
ncbi:hypothetical protein [Escherichia coli]|uniref:hypothetical protein n=1 Tax=Escherichia coli TaxID=562 RepID=UPI0031F313CE